MEKTCEGAFRLNEISESEIYSIGGFYLDKNIVANPCGLIAKSFFNGLWIIFNYKTFKLLYLLAKIKIKNLDSFSLFDLENKTITLEHTDISYPNYRQEIYEYFSDSEKERYIDANDGNFFN